MELRARSFRVGATSFVIPADWVTNVRRLAGRVDDVELLFFRAREPEDLPDTAQLEELGRCRRQAELSYTIHLPIDLPLAGPDEDGRRDAVAEVCRTIRAVRCLDPICWVLHVEGSCEGEDETPGAVERWQERALGSLRQVLAEGIPPRCLAIESLEYDFRRVLPVVDALGLSVALDLGHELRQGRSPEELVLANLDRTPVIHLHGVDEGGHDHRAISAVPRQLAGWLVRELTRRRWEGVLTLEVFDMARLEDSLCTLAHWLREEDVSHG